jgi:hypothetical protein
MAVFAVVNPEGGIVSNTISGESKEIVQKIVGSVVEVTEETGSASIGYLWDGNKFISLDSQTEESEES